MDNKIFCLETEWEQSIYDLRYDSKAKPLLEFLNNSSYIDFSFRQVATKADFEYYINHLKQPSYKNYSIVYLCFHGDRSKIYFADKGKCGGESFYDLRKFAKENPNVFENKCVHFGSCSTLKMKKEDIFEIKKQTGALMITGYERTVEMTESFIFEAWLLNTLNKHPNYRSSRLTKIALEEVPYFVERYKFVAY